MKIFSYFSLLLILLITIPIYTPNDFIPLKPGNGILNQPYNHSADERNLFFIFLNLRHGARSPLILKDRHNDMLGGNGKQEQI